MVKRKFGFFFFGGEGSAWMSCFLCFGSAQEGEAKKPGADSKDARKDGSADRGVSRVGSGAWRTTGSWN